MKHQIKDNIETIVFLENTTKILKKLINKIKKNK